MTPGPWLFETGDSPIVAAAIHAGHELHPTVRRAMAVEDSLRMQEEDAFTDTWTTGFANRIVMYVSRFEVDLDRPRERAVYLEPDDARGIEVWHVPPTREMYDRCLRLHDGFYQYASRFIDDLLQRHERVVVLDLHSCGQPRNGPDPAGRVQPEIAVGTHSVDRDAWGDLVGGLIEALARFDIRGRSFDVAEDRETEAGYFTAWVNDTYGTSVCSLALRVRRTFLDARTGRRRAISHPSVGAALRSTLPHVLESLR